MPLRHLTPSQNISPLKLPKHEINVDLFREVSKKTGYMADFVNSGLKYKHLVKNEKLDPW